MKLHVAICFTDDSGQHYKQALVTAISVFENTKSKVCLHILHDDTGENSQKAFADLCKRYNQEVKFYNVGGIPEFSKDCNDDSFFLGASFRLALQDVVHEERVIYLDTDIVCMIDLSGVNSIDDIDDCYIAAVRAGRNDEAKQIRRIGLHSDSYVNSGVLVMNLAKLRRDYPDFLQQCYRLRHEKKYK